MTQTTGGVNLPRKYLAEGYQASLDRQWDVKRTPGSQPGPELPFKELLQQQIERHVCLTLTLHYLFYFCSNMSELSSTVLILATITLANKLCNLAV